MRRMIGVDTEYETARQERTFAVSLVSMEERAIALCVMDAGYW